MNIIFGIAVLVFGWYLLRDVTKNGGTPSELGKAQAYGSVLMCIILGIGLIFNLIKFW